MTTYSPAQQQGGSAPEQAAGPMRIPQAPTDLTEMPSSPNCVAAVDKAMARTETLGSELGLS